MKVEIIGTVWPIQVTTLISLIGDRRPSATTGSAKFALAPAQSIHRRQIPGSVLLFQLAECCLARRCRLPIHVADLPAEWTVTSDLSIPRHKLGDVSVQLKTEYQETLHLLEGKEREGSSGLEVVCARPFQFQRQTTGRGWSNNG